MWRYSIETGTRKYIDWYGLASFVWKNKKIITGYRTRHFKNT